MVARFTSNALFLRCGLLALATLVFFCGLQAKLALYHTGANEAPNAVVKFSVERQLDRLAAVIRDHSEARSSTLKPFRLHPLDSSFEGIGIFRCEFELFEAANPFRFDLRLPKLADRPPPILS